MGFTAVEVNQHLFPVFEGENPQSWLRAAFLREAEACIPEVFELIRQAKDSVQQPVDWGGNETWVEFSLHHVVITHQWMYDQQGNELQIEIPLDEAEALLHAWHAALEAYRKQKK